MNQARRGDFGHGVTAWRLSGLGDDSSTLLGFGFNSLQIQQIEALHASCALSNGGYQALVSGYVDPGDLADFLLNDPGCDPAPAQAPRPSTVVGPSNQPAAQLAPGPAARMVYTQPLSATVSSFFTGSTLVAGIPNVVLLGGLFLGLPLLMNLMSPKAGRRR